MKGKNKLSSQKKSEKNIFLRIVVYLFALIGLVPLYWIAIFSLTTFLNLLLVVVIIIAALFFTQKKLDFRAFYPIVLYGLFVIGILFSSVIAFSYYSGWMQEQENPARQLAQIMPPFAEKNHLELIEKYNGSVGFPSDNQTPFYLYIYQGDQSLDEMKELVETYLKEQGYAITTNRYVYNENCTRITVWGDCDENSLRGSTVNNNKPYWVFKGLNNKGGKVEGEISNYTYDNSANDAGDNFGEQVVPPGKTVVVIDFVSHDVN